MPQGTYEQQIANGGNYSIKNDPTALAAYQTKTFTPTVAQASATGSPITTASLAPVTPLSVPTTPISTTGAGFSGFMEQYLTGQKEQIAQARKDAETARAQLTTERGSLTESMNQILGIGQEQIKMEEAAGIGGKAQKVTDYTNQLEAEQLGLRRQVESIQKNGNITTGQAQVKINAIERESLSKQADLALLQNAANRDLSTSQGIIDRKIQLTLEPLKQKLEFNKFFYSENKESLTKAEDRQFQLIQNKDKVAFAFAESEQKSIHSAFTTASENGAPESVLQSILRAKSSGEAMTAMGAYGQKKDLQFVSGTDNQVAGVFDKTTGKFTPTGGGMGGGKTPPTVKSINGVDMQWNPSTAKWEAISTSSTSNVLGNAIAGAKVDNINNILNSSALDSSAGPSGLARTNTGLWSAAKRFFSGALAGAVGGAIAGAPFAGVGAIPGAILGAVTTGVVNSLRGTKDELTGDRQNFIGSVEQMRSELTVEKLAQAKGQGVTFGALSDGERGLIANAATKIGSWAIHEGGTPDGTVIGYNIDEKSFKAEMDKINYFTKLDALIKGATPESVGAVTNPDGTVWIMNSDGTLTQMIRK